MKYAFALAAVAGLAAAQPHAGHAHLHKRQAAGAQTVTDWHVVTVTDVVTVYGPSPVGQVPSSAAALPSSGLAALPSSAAAAPSSQAIPTVASVPAGNSEPVKPQTQPTVAAPSSAAAPPSSSPAVAPAQPTSAVAQPAPSSAAASPSGGSGGGSSGGQCSEGTPCTGDMTTYTPGLGACGFTDSPTDATVVALAAGMMGAQGNGNPYCNKKIMIKNTKTGVTAPGVIRDKCPGCTGQAGLDLSLPLFEKLNAGQDTGRNPMEWWFTD